MTVMSHRWVGGKCDDVDEGRDGMAHRQEGMRRLSGKKEIKVMLLKHICRAC
jgi:hypothetical protein